jgi:hypothetical protein
MQKNFICTWVNSTYLCSFHFIVNRAGKDETAVLVDWMAGRMMHS